MSTYVAPHWSDRVIRVARETHVTKTPRPETNMSWVDRIIAKLRGE